jgi:hypothetical protein
VFAVRPEQGALECVYAESELIAVLPRAGRTLLACTDRAAQFTRVPKSVLRKPLIYRLRGQGPNKKGV